MTSSLKNTTTTKGQTCRPSQITCKSDKLGGNIKTMTTRCVCETQMPPIMANSKDGKGHKDIQISW